MPRTGSDWDAAEALRRVLADTDALIVKDERSFRCNGLRNSADLSWDAVERVLKGKYDSKVRAASSFLPLWYSLVTAYETAGTGHHYPAECV